MNRMFLKEYDKTAIIWKGEELSYRSLIKSAGNFLRAFPQKKCNKIAIFSENRSEWVYAFYAAWKGGSIAVPIDFMSTAEDVSYILEDCRPELIFCSSETRAVIDEVVEKLSYNVEILDFDEMKPSEEYADLSFPEHDPTDTAVIIYTSGTTGSPKGVMLSFDNLLANIESVTEEFKIYREQDNVLVFLPLHHIFPLLGTMVATLYVGGTMVFSPSMTSEDLMHTLKNYGITIFIGVPRLYNLISKGIMGKINSSILAKILYTSARYISSRAFSRVIFKKVHEGFGGKIRYLVSGGAKLDEDVARIFKTLGFEMLEGFGMTEAAPMITFTRPGEVLIGSAGRPMSCNEVKTVDGEIVAKGRNIMQGYYNRPEETAEIIRDGWLHTGDLGYLDEKNFIHITGRKKEIIILPNGKNVNPVELEQKMEARSEYIAEAAVFFNDNILQAVVYPDFRKVREKGLQNLEEVIRTEVIEPFNRSVSPYKKIMKLSILKEELPKTRLGKIKRFMLSSSIQAPDRKKEKGKEPETQEYNAIKEFLMSQAQKEIYPRDHFELDLGLDSLDMVSFQSFLYSTFGIEVNEDNFLDHPTVEKLSNFIAEKKEKISITTVKWAEIFKEKVDVKLPESWFAHNPMKNILKVLLGFYFRIKGKGTENLPSSPFILVSNHQSFIDGLLVLSFFKKKLNKNSYFYAKKKHVRSWWVKFLASRSNVIVMDINNELKLSLQKLAEVLRRGKNVIIFPEGTRTMDGKVGKFKKTFAILSKELNVPVVSVAIKGAFEAFPKGTIFPRPLKKIEVKFLEAVYPKDHTYDSLNVAVNKTVTEEVARGLAF
ncbi:AMP-binding protein [Thermodesulfobacteriota bacterium]